MIIPPAAPEPAPHADQRDARALHEPSLRRAGLKSTLPRLAILRILHGGNRRHLSAEDVFRELLAEGSELSLATVYRVLSQLEGAGLLKRHLFDSGKAFYEADDGTPHDHLLCLGCGAVLEFSSAAMDRSRREAAASNGYELAEHQLAVQGYCARCVQARQRPFPAGRFNE